MAVETLRVVEWRNPDGLWFPRVYNSRVRETRRDAWAEMRELREAYPGDTFRTTKYVPAPRKRAKGG